MLSVALTLRSKFKLKRYIDNGYFRLVRKNKQIMKIGTVYKRIIEVYNEKNYNFELIQLEDYKDPQMKDMDGIIAGRMSNEQIDTCPNLKHIYIPFTGKNGFDVDYTDANGIQIHTSHIHARYVAERALALAFAIMGKITLFDRNLRDGHWSMRNNHDRIYWNSLFDRRVGIYGYGTIGQWINKLVEPFNCSVTAYNRSQNEDVDYAQSISELVENSDIIFAAMPLTEETKSAINKDVLDKMQDKILINVGRGAVIDEEDLYNALKDSTLKGFASDVWYNYPKDEEDCYPTKHNLNEFNVVMTPHCAGFTDSSEQERYEDTLNTIEGQGDK